MKKARFPTTLTEIISVRKKSGHESQEGEAPAADCQQAGSAGASQNRQSLPGVARLVPPAKRIVGHAPGPKNHS